MWTDPIADLLTRIRNGVRNKSRQVKIPYSGVKLAVCKVLKEEGFVEDVDRIESKPTDLLRVTLKYGPHGEKVLSHIRRESKVGCRRYVGVNDIPRVLDGLGIAVLSTSRGVMSDRKCRQERVGGEVICTVY